MNYTETLDFLTHALPAYHRVGAAAYKADLSSTQALMAHLGHPEQGLRCIHVAGTNGKGSVSHFLAAMLHRAGLKVGLYTSPHLVDFRERIRVNGQMIPQEQVCSFVDGHHAFFVEEGLSFFEMTVGMAFDWFRSERVDVAVIEVGMGGRLDSTNVVSPDLCVITNIGFDHTQFLGHTLAAIAAEKAGIIKPGVPVVIGETHPETAPVFRHRAEEVGAPIFFADARYRVDELRDDEVLMHADILRDGQVWMPGVESPLDGIYQRKNIATVAAAYEQLVALGYPLDETHFREGLAHVVSDTGLRGRWERLSVNPTVICETAHNADGISTLVQKLRLMHPRRLRIVYGCVSDKDYPAILRMLPADADYYYTRPSVPRGLDETTLADAAEREGRPGPHFPDVQQALAAAKAVASPDDLIVVTGSIFLVADLLAAE